jgi:ABC-type lipoprotein export system ATPase subunit
MKTFVAAASHTQIEVKTLTIEPGIDKNGYPEPCEPITVSQGQLIGITGPTGSGKSRLLADIEYLAQMDTPTQRRVLLNGKKPETPVRFTPSFRLVAQVSQNMNFVLDLQVREFLELHAQCRGYVDSESVVEQVFEAGNKLAGEPFGFHTPLSSLSGGQSRALMIADVAYLSNSPIVVIDEIENAGINRNHALDLLTRQKKIVLIATHDPILALITDFRLVFHNGAIVKIVHTTNAEKELLSQLQQYDAHLLELRERLRNGSDLSSFVI